MDTGSAEGHLRRFRDTGDPEALGALFDATAPALFRVALRLTPDPASAEDALQETFLDLFDAAKEWDPTRPALPWLAGVLRHRVERVRRRESRRPDVRRLPPPAPPPEPPAAAAAAEDRDRARRAMLDLEEPYRSVALLRWQYGLEPAEIAEVRGEPPGTVWSLLSRAKEKLGKTLTGSGALAVALLPGSGLESVRAAVIRHAAAKAAAKAAVVGGGLLVSKKVFVAAVILCIAIGTSMTLLAPRGGFRGRVVDASTGRPVAGARVVLTGKTPAETVTDSDGRFLLEAEGRPASLVSVEASGLVRRSEMVTAGSTEEIQLGRGDTVVGRALAPDGSPAAGATVTLFARDGRRYGPTATDSGGRFRFEAVDPDNYHNCIVQAAGYGKFVRDFNPARDGPGHVDLGDLVLPPARRVEGTFLNGRGAPVVGERLVLHGPLELERASRAGGTSTTTTTDASGHFGFEGVAPGRYLLAYDRRNGMPYASRELLVGEGDLLDADLRFQQSGFLRVRVVDGDGNPQPGVMVYEEEGGVSARSGEDGVAVIENLPQKQRIHVTVQGGEGFPNWSFVDLQPPPPLLPDGSETTLVVAPADRIRGTVLDESGDPVLGAVVSGKGMWGYTTKDDGKFVITVARNATTDLRAHLEPSDPCLRAEMKAVKAPAEGVVLRFRRYPRDGSLHIRILDPSGIPVGGVGFIVYAGEEERPIRTDGAGRAVLEGIPAAETAFFAWLTPQGPDEPWPLPGGAALPPLVTVLPDGRDLDVRLLPGAEIRGTVVDGEGKPVPKARVNARKGTEWSSTQGTTDERGRFRVVVPAGESSLLVRAFVSGADGRGYVTEERDIRPGTTDLVLHLEKD